ncbi:MAG TPA: hypothetical protein VK158_04275 [Acidobacteriota bacterium]|nr:hypothetical protein [Acidobacteriota bacterium]
MSKTAHTQKPVDNPLDTMSTWHTIIYYLGIVASIGVLFVWLLILMSWLLFKDSDPTTYYSIKKAVFLLLGYLTLIIIAAVLWNLG